MKLGRQRSVQFTTLVQMALHRDTLELKQASTFSATDGLSMLQSLSNLFELLDGLRRCAFKQTRLEVAGAARQNVGFETFDGHIGACLVVDAIRKSASHIARLNANELVMNLTMSLARKVRLIARTKIVRESRTAHAVISVFLISDKVDGPTLLLLHLLVAVRNWSHSADSAGLHSRHHHVQHRRSRGWIGRKTSKNFGIAHQGRNDLTLDLLRFGCVLVVALIVIGVSNVLVVALIVIVVGFKTTTSSRQKKFKTLPLLP